MTFTHRTLEAQGIDREPTIHIGATAKAMEQAGRKSDRMREYNEIVARNEALNSEKTAEYMHELKQGYAMLDKEINAINQENINNQREMQALKHDALEITKRTEQFNKTQEQLEELRTQRQEMGVFGNKKSIEDKIKQLERSQEQAKNYLKQKHHIAPEEAQAKLKRLEYKVKDIELIQERLQDKMNSYVADKDVFMLEYQRQKLLAEINPNSQRIQDELTRLDKDDRLRNHSIQHELALTRSERTLDMLTDSNFEEILKEVHPEQAKALIEHRERLKGQEQSRGFWRGHF